MEKLKKGVVRFQEVFQKKFQEMLQEESQVLMQNLEVVEKKEVKNEKKNIVSSTKKERDRSLYNIWYNGNLEEEDINKANFAAKTISILDKYELIDDKAFRFLRNDRTSGFILLKTIEELTEGEIRYSRYQNKKDKTPDLIFKGKAYFVIKNWSKDTVDKFIIKMVSEFKGLKYRIEK